MKLKSTTKGGRPTKARSLFDLRERSISILELALGDKKLEVRLQAAAVVLANQPDVSLPPLKSRRRAQKIELAAPEPAPIEQVEPSEEEVLAAAERLLEERRGS